jgi:uncharacterized protein
METEKHFDQQFVEFIVSSIVENPDDVATERIVDEMGTLISLHVHADDMSTIIGKEGRTAKALRTILRVLGAKHNERTNLKIIEPEGGKGYQTPLISERTDRLDMPELPSTPAPSAAVTAALADIPTDELA